MTDATKRIVSFKLQGKVHLPCDVAHQIRELLENNATEGTAWSYTIADLS